MAKISYVLFYIFVWLCMVPGRLIRRDDQTKLPVSDCLLSKWDTWIRSFDVNDDGVVTLEDMDKACNRFTKLHKLHGKDKSIVEEKLSLFWTTMVLWNGTTITPGEFIINHTDAFMQDRQNFISRMQKGEELIHDIVDVNNYGYISEKEETIILVATGRTDEQEDRDFFQALEPEEKGESLENMTRIWVDYLTNEACSGIENAVRKLEQNE